MNSASLLVRIQPKVTNCPLFLWTTSLQVHSKPSSIEFLFNFSCWLLQEFFNQGILSEFRKALQRNYNRGLLLSFFWWGCGVVLMLSYYWQFKQNLHFTCMQPWICEQLSMILSFHTNREKCRQIQVKVQKAILLVGIMIFVYTN